MNPIKPILQKGKTYFVCMYYLEKLPVPCIETWVYVGPSDTEQESEGKEFFHYFERPEVHYKEEIAIENAKFAMPSEEAHQEMEKPKMRVADSELEALVYDYEGLKDWVCSLGSEPHAKKVL